MKYESSTFKRLIEIITIIYECSSQILDKNHTINVHTLGLQIQNNY